MEGEDTWEGKDDIEASSSQHWGEPAFSPVQQHQHQTCTHRKGIVACVSSEWLPFYIEDSTPCFLDTLRRVQQKLAVLMHHL